ncbi:alpha/beta hydrolase [Acaryochloris sp. IP29b_bin.137]|uniref:esterase/lipase family protein n=1 Tax=Acaryochloris sp. IP29b_bin.137 TaxID=2969217 RepID=UPI0026065E3E|nr:alpha/beta hydrolase [Acaryochloris sp. IP29b_bin.137]
MKVLLIHGLGRSPLSVFGLSQFLQLEGYQTALFGYSSLIEPYTQIIERLQDRLLELEAEPYAIIAHSLGAVLVRSALTTKPKLTPNPIILLGPPNQSPRIAQLARRLSPFSFIAGECFQNLADPNFFRQLPPLSQKHIIIAGTGGPRAPWRFFGEEINDGVLTLQEMQVQECEVFQSVTPSTTKGCLKLLLPVQHTQMLNHGLVQRAIMDILSGSNPRASSETPALP